MPAITREDIAPNQIAIHVTLTPEDYQEKYEKELNEYRKNATLKGFRKGKTPASVVRNLFGKQVLAKILDEQLQKAIAHYLREEDLQLLGNVIPTNDTERIELDVRQMQEYPFHFEAALMPHVDVKGIAASDTYEQYIVSISEEMVEAEWQELRQEARQELPLEEDEMPTPDDFVRFQVAAADGAPLSEDLKTHSFHCLIAEIQDENFRQQVLNAHIGANLQVDNIYDLFPGEPVEVYVKRMQLPEHMLEALPSAFQFTVEDFFQENYTIDQDLLDDYFGPGEVIEEDQVREHLRKSIEKYWENHSNELLWTTMRKRMLEETTVDYPEEFIRKQIRYKATTELSEEKVEEALDAFKSKFKWRIILNTLAKHHGIKVSEQDLLEYFYVLYKNLWGRYIKLDDERLLDMAYEALQDEKRSNEAVSSILANKLMPQLVQQVTLVPKEVTPDEIQDMLHQQRPNTMPLAADTADDATDEESMELDADTTGE